jgi:hypothetical protein
MCVGCRFDMGLGDRPKGLLVSPQRITGALLPLLKFGTACVLPLETQFSSVRVGMRGLFSIGEERAIDVANFPNFNISFSNFSRAGKDSVITFNR